jgi:hypothetical protein
MSHLLIALFVIVCLLLLSWGLKERGRIYEFPFLAAGIFLGWVLPQLFGLANDPFIPAGAFDKAMVMTILCALMILAGRCAVQRPFQALNWQYDENKLVWVAAVLVLVGGFFFFKISRLPEEVQAQTQASGVLVAYLFFAEMLTYGFCISIIAFVRSFSLPSLLVSAYCFVFYFDRIIIAGRRAALVDFSLTILLALWFQRQISLPRWLMLIALLFGGIGVHSVGDYRSIANSDGKRDWADMMDIHPIENLEKLIVQGGNEMRNAVYSIYGTEASLGFDFGLWHWNTIVFNFVPAQLLGHDFKASLQVPLPSDNLFYQLDYAPDTGSTMTGMADAFGSFWYFGALKFFIIAFIMGKLYRAAMEGHLIAQILYIILLGAALHTITHHTQRFLSQWIQMMILLFPVLYIYRSYTTRNGVAHVERLEG